MLTCPIFSPALLKNSSFLRILSDVCTKTFNDRGLVLPIQSSLKVSLSNASRTNSRPAATSLSIFFRVNSSFQVASLPALSLTDVLRVLPLYLNWIKGSYFPKASKSLRNLAFRIMSFTMHLSVNAFSIWFLLLACSYCEVYSTGFDSFLFGGSGTAILGG